MKDILNVYLALKNYNRENNSKGIKLQSIIDIESKPSKNPDYGNLPEKKVSNSLIRN